MTPSSSSKRWFPLRHKTVIFNIYLCILLAELALSIFLRLDMTQQQRKKVTSGPETVLYLSAITVFWTFTLSTHALNNNIFVELFNFFFGLLLMPTWLTIAIFASIADARCRRSTYHSCSYVKAVDALTWIETLLIILVGFMPPSFEVFWKGVYHSGSRLFFLARRLRMHAKRYAQSFLDIFPRKFCCAICLEDMSLRRAVRFYPCRHPCCKDCARGYIQSKLEDKALPVLCPICVTEPGRPSGKIGALDDIVLKRLRLLEDMATVMSEIEVSQNFALVDCPNCERATYIKKDEFNQSTIITCPSPGCKYVWCKTCSWASGDVTTDATLHSCEGAVELRDLINKQGWRYCPGCRTPTERIVGCNHIKCNAPGCFTHFCYACGQAVLSNEFNGHSKTCSGRTTYV